MAEFEKMELESADLVADRIAQLRELMPEVFAESGIDFDKLRLVLGDEVDEGTERYAFTWPGKADAIRQSQTPSSATLRPASEVSVNWDETENLYIEGDNLEVLKLLQHSYHGRIKMIFIDPPYNTGNDFVYKDKFGDTIENYRTQAGLTGQSNGDTSGRYHSDWCSMMYPRLKLARELLADDGVIFISIGEEEQSRLRTICDEIFGETNCAAQFIWEKAYSPRMDVTGVSTVHDYILCYVKAHRDAIQEERFVQNDSQFNFVDQATGKRYRRRSVRKEGSHSTRAERPNSFFAFTAPDGTEVYPIKPDGTEGCWRWSRETYAESVKQGIVEWVQTDNGWQVYAKQFLNDEATRPVMSLWKCDEVGHNHEATEYLKKLLDGKVFDSPKPIGLLRKILTIATYPHNDDVVLDFFSGSATTAEAVIRSNAEDGGNRHFIMIQLPEKCDESSNAFRAGYANICQIGQERIRRAGLAVTNEMHEANKQLRLGESPKPIPDIGFRVLRLDESGIERPKPGELLLDVVKTDRTDEDIIFEMMLKWGLELTLPIEKVDAAGYPCYSVAYGELVCCLAPGLNMQVLDAIADMEPRRVLMLDRNLDDTTKLNAVQAFKRVEEKTGREVELRTV